MVETADAVRALLVLAAYGLIAVCVLGLAFLGLAHLVSWVFGKIE